MVNGTGLAWGGLANRGDIEDRKDGNRGKAVSGLAVFHNFIDAAQKVRAAKDLESLVGDAAREIGFDYFALVHHVDLSNIAAGHLVALTSYPWTWVETYIERRIVINDPVHLASHRTNIGFRWDDVPKLVN